MLVATFVDIAFKVFATFWFIAVLSVVVYSIRNSYQDAKGRSSE